MSKIQLKAGKRTLKSGKQILSDGDPCCCMSDTTDPCEHCSSGVSPRQYTLTLTDFEWCTGCLQHGINFKWFKVISGNINGTYTLTRSPLPAPESNPLGCFWFVEVTGTIVIREYLSQTDCNNDQNYVEHTNFNIGFTIGSFSGTGYFEVLIGKNDFDFYSSTATTPDVLIDCSTQKNSDNENTTCPSAYGTFLGKNGSVVITPVI